MAEKKKEENKNFEITTKTFTGVPVTTRTSDKNEALKAAKRGDEVKQNYGGMWYKKKK